MPPPPPEPQEGPALPTPKLGLDLQNWEVTHLCCLRALSPFPQQQKMNSLASPDMAGQVRSGMLTE